MTKEISAISKELKNVQNCAQTIINSFQKFFLPLSTASAEMMNFTNNIILLKSTFDMSDIVSSLAIMNETLATTKTSIKFFGRFKILMRYYLNKLNAYSFL